MPLLRAREDRSPQSGTGIAKRPRPGRQSDGELAVWQYADATVRYLYPPVLGDPDLDKLLAALEKAPQGLTRTRVYALFNRNKRSEEIDRLLATVVRSGRVEVADQKTGGRPAQVWRLTT